MFDDKTWALIKKKVLDEKLNSKLEEMMVKILRAIGKQPIKGNTETGTE